MLFLKLKYTSTDPSCNLDRAIPLSVTLATFSPPAIAALWLSYWEDGIDYGSWRDAEAVSR